MLRSINMKCWQLALRSLNRDRRRAAFPILPWSSSMWLSYSSDAQYLERQSPKALDVGQLDGPGLLPPFGVRRIRVVTRDCTLNPFWRPVTDDLLPPKSLHAPTPLPRHSLRLHPFNNSLNESLLTIRDHGSMIPRARVSILLSSNSLRCFNPPLIRHFSTPPRPPSDKDQSPEPIQFPKYNVKTYGADVKKFSQLPVNFGANQHISIDDQLKEKLRSVLWKFNAPIRYAFAYGSGVFQQANADPKDVTSVALGFVNGKMPMVDFIFGVSHTQHWHGLNLVQNPHHYSGMRYLGSGAISWVQDHSGAGVYFNPYVEVGGLTIKYGVVNIETLCRDLLEWDTLYLAGRLQKPVKILRDEPRVRLANQVNLVSALRAALLLLPEEFTEFDLYSTIAGLSYMGDFRTRLPTENPQKVQNIVTKQVVHFRRLYSPLLDTLPNVTISQDHTDPSHTILKQDFSPTRRANMVARLPSSFKSILYRHYARKFNVPLGQLQSGDAYGGEFEMKVAADEGLRAEVKRSIRETVGWVSFVQTFKGLFTAGVGRSIKYVFAKIGKWWSGQGKVDVGKDKEK